MVPHFDLKDSRRARRGSPGWSRLPSWAGAVLLLVLLWGNSGCGLFVKTRGEAVQPRTRAPGFSLEDQVGQTHALAELLEKGPVVIVFYRGHW